MGTMVIFATGLLFLYLGTILDKLKRNWFIGIRTPWTLSSEKVWEKTHRIGGILFKISGLIILAGMFAPEHLLLFVLIPVFATVVFLIIYSYLEYRKL